MSMLYNIREKPEKNSLAKRKLIFSIPNALFEKAHTPSIPRLSEASFVVKFAPLHCYIKFYSS